jgi:hypothetical protein
MALKRRLLLHASDIKQPTTSCLMTNYSPQKGSMQIVSCTKQPFRIGFPSAIISQEGGGDWVDYGKAGLMGFWLRYLGSTINF